MKPRPFCWIHFIPPFLPYLPPAPAPGLSWKQDCTKSAQRMELDSLDESKDNDTALDTRAPVRVCFQGSFLCTFGVEGEIRWPPGSLSNPRGAGRATGQGPWVVYVPQASGLWEDAFWSQAGTEPRQNSGDRTAGRWGGMNGSRSPEVRLTSGGNHWTLGGFWG